MRVTFRVNRGTEFGKETRASVRIKTVLGQKFLMLEPKGSGQLAAGSEIPISRTVAAYDVVEAFSDLATTAEDIDTEQYAKALDTIATTFEDSPEEVRGAVDGLGRLSRTIASRDAQLRELLDHTAGVSEVLADRNEEFVSLLADGDLLLQELQKRRAGHPRPAGQHVQAVHPAHGAGAREPQGDRAGPAEPGATSSRCCAPTRPTSTRASS